MLQANKNEFNSQSVIWWKRRTNCDFLFLIPEPIFFFFFSGKIALRPVCNIPRKRQFTVAPKFAQNFFFAVIIDSQILLLFSLVTNLQKV